MAAPLALKADEFVPGTPQVLFENHQIWCFDVDPDGKHFLVAEDPNPGAQTKLNVVVNWCAEVRRKLQEARTP